jgi:beta-glucanase (GH16 family)
MTAKKLFAIGTFFILFGVFAIDARAQNWTLTWSDEFFGRVNGTPNSLNWTYDLGGNGWGNNELQSYTNRTQNAYLDGEGNLAIKVIKETFTGADGITRNYTSARLLTKTRFEQKYGRFEARIKVPFGQGIWPAFWMLGSDIDKVGWPACGEIDIMENIGKEPAINHGSLHGPGYSGGNPLTGIFTLPDGQKFSDDFHVFAVEWEPTQIRFYVDGNLYQTKTSANVPAGSRWVFDHPFFMILNIAVGGNFPGNPDETTTYPQTMLVDYVKVYANEDKRPAIRNVTVEKKNLVVTGDNFDNFDNDSAIFVDGEKQKTLFDEQGAPIFIGKKTAKRIASGQTVKIQVKNSYGLLSSEISFTKP